MGFNKVTYNVFCCLILLLNSYLEDHVSFGIIEISKKKLDISFTEVCFGKC